MKFFFSSQNIVPENAPVFHKMDSQNPKATELLLKNYHQIKISCILNTVRCVRYTFKTFYIKKRFNFVGKTYAIHLHVCHNFLLLLNI